MANWSPISGTLPQYDKSAAAGSGPASGYFLKFYNTSNVAINMASDKDGGGLLAKAQLDSSGYPLNGSGARFIPFINQEYKPALYTNTTDADADTTGNADWFPVTIPRTLTGASVVTSNIGIGDSSTLNPATISGSCNLAIMDSAGAALTSGSRNLLGGVNAGAALTTGQDNVAWGDNSLCTATINCQNVAMGTSALKTLNSTCLTFSRFNVAVGHQSAEAATTARCLTAIGYCALVNNTCGCNNTAVGAGSMSCNTIGKCNAAYGRDSILLGLYGDCNTAIGEEALQQSGSVTTTLDTGTADGTQSAHLIDSTQNFSSTVTIGNLVCNITDNTHARISAVCSNTCLGLDQDNFVSGEAYCIVGTGSKNTAIGMESGRCITTGCYNVALGASSMIGAGVSGCFNISAGCIALNSLTSGGHNIGLGRQALSGASTAENNIGIGCFAAINLSSGADNILMGRGVGSFWTVGNCNIALGACVGSAVYLADSGTTDGGGDGLLVDSTQDFLSTVAVGTIACNITDGGTATVLSVIDNTSLCITENASPPYRFPTGKAYCINKTSGSGNILIGHELGKTNQLGSTSCILAIDTNDVTHPLVWGDLTPATKRLVIPHELGFASAEETLGYGRFGFKTAEETHTLSLAGTSVTTSITVPVGARLEGVSLNVDTAVTNGGDNTWKADFSTGSTTAIAALGTAAAQDTKVNTILVPEIVAGGAAEITFTPQGGSFTAGVIKAVVYYSVLTDLANDGV